MFERSTFHSDDRRGSSPSDWSRRPTLGFCLGDQPCVQCRCGVHLVRCTHWMFIWLLNSWERLWVTTLASTAVGVSTETTEDLGVSLGLSLFSTWLSAVSTGTSAGFLRPLLCSTTISKCLTGSVGRLTDGLVCSTRLLKVSTGVAVSWPVIGESSSNLLFRGGLMVACFNCCCCFSISLSSCCSARSKLACIRRIEV